MASGQKQLDTMACGQEKRPRTPDGQKKRPKTPDGNVNPGKSFKNKKLLITYDTGDTGLDQAKANKNAFATETAEGIQFEFTGDTPENHHFHISGAIPFEVVRIKNPKSKNKDPDKIEPKVTVDSGDVKALYDIEVINEAVFTSKF